MTLGELRERLAAIDPVYDCLTVFMVRDYWKGTGELIAVEVEAGREVRIVGDLINDDDDD